MIRPPGYDPKTAEEFIKKGDSILEKEIAYQDLGERIPDLNVMREACLYYYSLSEIDRVLYKPSWTDSMSIWRFKAEEESGDKKKFVQNTIQKSYHWEF